MQECSLIFLNFTWQVKKNKNKKQKIKFDTVSTEPNLNFECY